MLTQTAEYALRVLTYLAAQPSRDAVRARDLAEATEIPLAYLSKILRRLVEAGLLHSQKGHGGGFRFARPLSEIRFIDVLDAVNFDVEPTACAFGWDQCSTTDPCPLHPFWSDLKEQFAQWARRYTLADVPLEGP